MRFTHRNFLNTPANRQGYFFMQTFGDFLAEGFNQDDRVEQYFQRILRACNLTPPDDFSALDKLVSKGEDSWGVSYKQAMKLLSMLDSDTRFRKIQFGKPTAKPHLGGTIGALIDAKRLNPRKDDYYHESTFGANHSTIHICVGLPFDNWPSSITIWNV